MAKSEYRGQDTVLEKIQELVAESDLTWNEACNTVCDRLHGEGLFSSATYALDQKVEV